MATRRKTKRRSRGLGSVEASPRRKFATSARLALSSAKRAVSAAKSGYCGEALDKLLDAERAVGATLAHAKSTPGRRMYSRALDKVLNTVDNARKQFGSRGTCKI